MVMAGLDSIRFEEKCTVVESIYGEVKLIRRSLESRPALVTLCFPNLRDCLEYADRNQFQINVMYSGKKKTEDEKSSLQAP